MGCWVVGHLEETVWSLWGKNDILYVRWNKWSFFFIMSAKVGYLWTIITIIMIIIA